MRDDPNHIPYPDVMMHHPVQPYIWLQEKKEEEKVHARTIRHHAMNVS